MHKKYHLCGYPVECAESGGENAEPAAFFDGLRSGEPLSLCPACGVPLRMEDLQDYWDDLEMELH
ncbi:MAG: hypothetical protein GX443_14485 [Deltaproteobacteria bacterium]|nr:hypothetical protein [Deltaproteobacteria bacterium]